MTIREDIAPADQQIEQRPDLESHVIESLSQTSYRCLSLKQLSGGLGNFTFRGSLYSPLPDNERSIIVKHSLPYEKTGKLDLPLTRCAAEALSLAIMRGYLFQHANVSIRPPHYLYFDKHANIRVIEDIPNCGTLRDHLYLNKAIPHSTAIRIGESLGRWLSEFHSRDWSHIDQEVTSTLHENTVALQISKVPFEITMSVFQEDPLAKESISKAFSQHYTGRLSVLHGDFSTRNLLLQSHQESKQDDINLALIDWELCRYGCITQDLASMISCLYIQWQFEDTPSAEFMLRGFIRGYGHLNDDLVFRMAGPIAFLIVIWENFGIIIGDKTETRAREVYQHAKEFLVGAAQRDANWLSQNILSEFLKG